MKDFVGLFEDKLSRKQVRLRVEKLVTNQQLKQEGESSSSIYEIGEKFINNMELLSEALSLGLKALEKEKDNKTERTRKRPEKK